MIRVVESTWIDSGYVHSKEGLENVKKKWAEKDPEAKVRRVKTDTKGLIMYVVEK